MILRITEKDDLRIEILESGYINIQLPNGRSLTLGYNEEYNGVSITLDQRNEKVYLRTESIEYDPKHSGEYAFIDINY
jgi:hypothetical protein